MAENDDTNGGGVEVDDAGGDDLNACTECGYLTTNFAHLTAHIERHLSGKKQHRVSAGGLLQNDAHKMAANENANNVEDGDQQWPSLYRAREEEMSSQQAQRSLPPTALATATPMTTTFFGDAEKEEEPSTPTPSDSGDGNDGESAGANEDHNNNGNNNDVCRQSRTPLPKEATVNGCDDDISEGERTALRHLTSPSHINGGAIAAAMTATSSPLEKHRESPLPSLSLSWSPLNLNVAATMTVCDGTASSLENSPPLAMTCVDYADNDGTGAINATTTVVITPTTKRKAKPKKATANGENGEYGGDDSGGVGSNGINAGRQRGSGVKKLLSCQYCEFTTVMSQHMKSHLEAHETHQGQMYECDLCHTEFSQKANMHRHRLRHSGVKPFKCAYCAKEFFRKDQMQEHSMTHIKTGTDFDCPVVECMRRFTQHAALKQHLTDEHVISSTSQANCKRCTLSFSNSRRLLLHYQTKHDNYTSSSGVDGSINVNETSGVDATAASSSSSLSPTAKETPPPLSLPPPHLLLASAPILASPVEQQLMLLRLISEGGGGTGCGAAPTAIAGGSPTLADVAAYSHRHHQQVLEEYHRRRHLDAPSSSCSSATPTKRRRRRRPSSPTTNKAAPTLARKRFRPNKRVVDIGEPTTAATEWPPLLNLNGLGAGACDSRASGYDVEELLRRGQRAFMERILLLNSKATACNDSDGRVSNNNNGELTPPPPHPTTTATKSMSINSGDSAGAKRCVAAAADDANGIDANELNSESGHCATSEFAVAADKDGTSMQILPRSKSPDCQNLVLNGYNRGNIRDDREETITAFSLLPPASSSVNDKKRGGVATSVTVAASSSSALTAYDGDIDECCLLDLRCSSSNGVGVARTSHHNNDERKTRPTTAATTTSTISSSSNKEHAKDVKPRQRHRRRALKYSQQQQQAKHEHNVPVVVTTAASDSPPPTTLHRPLLPVTAAAAAVGSTTAISNHCHHHNEPHYHSPSSSDSSASPRPNCTAVAAVAEDASSTTTTATTTSSSNSSNGSGDAAPSSLEQQQRCHRQLCAISTSLEQAPLPQFQQHHHPHPSLAPPVSLMMASPSTAFLDPMMMASAVAASASEHFNSAHSLPHHPLLLQMLQMQHHAAALTAAANIANVPPTTTAPFGRLDEQQLECCTHCGLYFADATLYLLHKGLHSDSNAWRCNLCGQACADKYTFTAHIITADHSGGGGIGVGCAN